MDAKQLANAAQALMEGTLLKNKNKVSDKLNDIKFASLYADKNAQAKLNKDLEKTVDNREEFDEDDDFYGYWEDIYSDKDVTDVTDADVNENAITDSFEGDINPNDSDLYSLESTDIIGEKELSDEIDALFETIDNTNIDAIESDIDAQLESLERELDSELDSLTESQLDQEQGQSMEDSGFLENDDLAFFESDIDEESFSAELDNLDSNVQQDKDIEVEVNLDSVALEESEAMAALEAEFNDSESLEFLFEDDNFIDDDIDDDIVIDNANATVVEEPLAIAAEHVDKCNNTIDDPNKEELQIDDSDINVVDSALQGSPQAYDSTEEIISTADDYKQDGLPADAEDEQSDYLENDMSFFLLESDDSDDEDDDKDHDGVPDEDEDHGELPDDFEGDHNDAENLDEDDDDSDEDDSDDDDSDDADDADDDDLEFTFEDK